MMVPEATLVAIGPEGALEGIVVTTLVAPATAHIAQVAVDPAARGRGTGAALLQAASGAARALGARRVTLLVSESNAAARSLYARVGFTPASVFLYGQRGPAPRRLADVRPASESAVPLAL
jgi:ribosomal protein S18 acetylase RimI-like enzyme